VEVAAIIDPTRRYISRSNLVISELLGSSIEPAFERAERPRG
jgi:hypothetical protein